MNDTHDASDVPIRSVREFGVAGSVPRLVHPEWRERWSWLVQGTTTPGPDRSWDFGLFGPGAVGRVVGRWEALLEETDMLSGVHARQRHEATVRTHAAATPGLYLCEPADAHATRSARHMLAVTVADCVPVFIVAERPRVVAMVHAGWRGAAAGILERAVAVLQEGFGASPRDLFLHLGPSICGACYEVGPEVHEALGLTVPEGPTPVDLPSGLAQRARSVGVPASAVTRSGHCTRCGEVDLFSHRGGDAGRQIGFIGLR